MCGGSESRIANFQVRASAGGLGGVCVEGGRIALHAAIGFNKNRCIGCVLEQLLGIHEIKNIKTYLETLIPIFTMSAGDGYADAYASDEQRFHAMTGGVKRSRSMHSDGSLVGLLHSSKN